MSRIDESFARVLNIELNEDMPLNEFAIADGMWISDDLLSVEEIEEFLERLKDQLDFLIEREKHWGIDKKSQLDKKELTKKIETLSELLNNKKNR